MPDANDGVLHGGALRICLLARASLTITRKTREKDAEVNELTSAKQICGDYVVSASIR